MARRQHRRRRLHASRRIRGGSRRPRDWSENEPFRRRGDSREILHDAEATRIQIKGRGEFAVDLSALKIPPAPEVLSDEEIRAFVREHPLKVVAATVGEDEHSVGLREIIDIKHGGIEKYGVACDYLGTSVPSKTRGRGDRTQRRRDSDVDDHLP